MRRQLLLLALAGLLAVSLATDKPAEEPAAAKAEEKAAEKAVEEKKEPEYAYKELEDWVIANGGAVNTRIGVNKQGYRGLFAKQAFAKDDIMVSIPAACYINAGSVNGAFLTPTLITLRELFHPASRFQPYLKSFPNKTEVVNACNIPEKYWHLLEHDWLINFVKGWQDYLSASADRGTNTDAEFSPSEVLGSRKLTFDDVAYGCALSSTRYVASGTRNRLMMIPIYDMANHRRNCPHYLDYTEPDVVHFRAGEKVKKDQELCYGYGDMRDDYAVLHYGFLPAMEKPPRLLQVDHHKFNPSSHHQDLDDTRFTGSVEEMKKERDRQKAVLEKLVEADKEREKEKDKYPKPGTEYTYDLLIGLQMRRRAALKYEVWRLTNILRSLGIEPALDEL